MQLTQAQYDIFSTVSMVEFMIKLGFEIEVNDELVDMFTSIATLRMFVEID
jgi:hypothetical protein